MLDEEKIKLMTKVTIYEKHEEMGDMILSRYYREDYVQYGCLKTLVATTFCYWITVAVYILLKFEKVLADLNNIDYFKIITWLMVGYVGVMVVFYLYAFVVFRSPLCPFAYLVAFMPPHSIQAIKPLYKSSSSKYDRTVSLFNSSGRFFRMESKVGFASDTVLKNRGVYPFFQA